MRTIAANLNSPLPPPRTVGELVARRDSPRFFESDYVKIILPLLQEGDLGAAGVVDDDGLLTGLLTERSILRHVFARSSDRWIHSSNVKKYIDDMMVMDAMIPAPDTLDDDTGVEEAAGLMLRRGYRFMPVVSRYDRRHLLGIVSERELALQLQQRLQEARRQERAQSSILTYMMAEPYGSGGHAES
ncbi:MAG TPA: CBS domain-containing protein [Patescibacteria group bacterium]|nr:CBS domain-containing protein [Patescibacteria group bacterium]